MTRRRTALWTAVGALLVVCAGGATAAELRHTGSSVPATVLDVPAAPEPGVTAPSAFPAVDVSVRPGQDFGIRYDVGSYPEQWTFGNAEDTSVVQRGKSITVSTPPKGNVGGASTYVQVYRALKPGTTRIVWNLTCGQQVGACHFTEAFEVTVSAGS